jgi:hypothetical protein
VLANRRDDVVVLSLLSVAAGFLHAAVIDAHRGHGIAAGVFAALAVFQIAWAGLVLVRPNRGVLAVGSIVNAAIVLGWIVSRTSGIGFLDGFEGKEAVGFTDSVTTGLEVLIAIGAGLLASSPERRLLPTTLRPVGVGLVVFAVAGLGVPAAAEANSHAEDHAHADDAAGHAHAEGEHAAGDEHASHSPEEHAEHADHAAFPIITVDESGKLIGGDPNATAEQRAAAEKLLADTKAGFWQWTDEKAVHAAGFRSIGDGGTGTEHLVNWNWIEDDVVLDPDFPESLVYDVEPDGTRRLAAAMYMVPSATPDEEVPDVGGTLTQWHIHNNLCYSPAEMVDGFPQRRVVGVNAGDGNCAFGEALGPPHAPMLHVWLRPHECGPFSSLEGVGAGQKINEAEDTVTPQECRHSH